MGRSAQWGTGRPSRGEVALPQGCRTIRAEAFGFIACQARR